MEHFSWHLQFLSPSSGSCSLINWRRNGLKAKFNQTIILGRVCNSPLSLLFMAQKKVSKQRASFSPITMELQSLALLLLVSSEIHNWFSGVLSTDFYGTHASSRLIREAKLKKGPVMSHGPGFVAASTFPVWQSLFSRSRNLSLGHQRKWITVGSIFLDINQGPLLENRRS